MSRENENAGRTGNVPEALAVLRGVWHARGQTSVDIDEACGTTKACKNAASLGFQGMGDAEAPAEGSSVVSSDLRAAWRAKLEREGKLHPEAKSVRDLVFGSSEPKQ
ncbi:MAG: hypothetical protein ACRD0K_07490 [Egibacteraceae bacterium]